MDPCVFLSYNGRGKVDGFVFLYLDDLKGAGDTTGKSDSSWASPLAEHQKPRASTVPGSENTTGSDCGADVHQRGPLGSVELKIQTYTRKHNPVTLDNLLLSKHQEVGCCA